MDDIVYPHTERSNVVDTHFGETVADPFRWLENLAQNDAKVAGWIKAQNALTEMYLATLPGRDVFKTRIGALLDHERRSPPLKRGGRYFFTRNEGLANQPVLCVRENASGENRVLIDPNMWSEDSADALGEWAASDDGRYLAFGVQTGGTDWRTLKVLDVDTGKELGDFVEWARFTTLVWTPDGSGFFYSRYPKPNAEDVLSASVANHAVYFHKLGTPQSSDQLIYDTPDRPNLLHMCGRAVDSDYLSIYSTPGTTEVALTVVDLIASRWTPRTIFADVTVEWHLLGADGTRLILITTDGAPRRRIVSFDLAADRPELTEIIPEAANNAVLNDAALLGGKLLICYLVDAKTEIHRFNLDGTRDGGVALPGIGTAGGLSGHPSDNEAFFVFTSFDVPTTIYRYDVAANTMTPWAQPSVPIDLSQFAVEQRFYRSKDGTEVPMFLVRRRDVTGPAPTLLYGYGGFGISQIPVFSPAQLAWVEQGGIYALANIRGGGEYGAAWHRAGKLDQKQNAFDDFIAAGEYLKAEGITSAGGLAVQGESGGGLLVGAVVNQRPDLFDAALPGVGVLDMVRYDNFTGGILWVGEFGSTADAAQFRNLLSYSPYHNIKGGSDYPAILATTADADDRVVPAHTFKYVAALQSSDLGARPQLVRIETRAGHGGGMPLDKYIAMTADLWAFAARWTGLQVGAEANRT
jgi:prolyl oligopeptidase